MEFLVTMDIVFQHGEFYTDGGSWLKDVLIPILGVVATLIAVLLTYKADKKKDNQIRELNFKNREAYLRARIVGANKSIIKQVNAIKELSDKISNDLFNIPSMTKVIQSDLSDIVTKISQEEHYHAYLFVHGSTDQVRRKYFNIFSLYNYFYSNFEVIEDSISKSIEYDFQRKVECKKVIEDTMDIINKLINRKDIKEKYSTMASRLITLYNTFYENMPKNASFDYFEKNFISPSRQIMLADSQKDSDIENCMYMLKKCVFLLNEIKNQNEIVAYNLAEDYVLLKDKIKELNTLTS